MFPSKLPFCAVVAGSLQQYWSVTACVLLHDIASLVLVSTLQIAKTPSSSSTQWQSTFASRVLVVVGSSWGSQNHTTVVEC